jgi:hypothetical protein
VFAERKVQRRAERKMQRLCTGYQTSRHADKDVSDVSVIVPLNILNYVFARDPPSIVVEPCRPPRTPWSRQGLLV